MTSPIDISPDHLKTVRLILRENLSHSVAVWAFGSRANWTTNDSSDLDLALEGDSALDHDTIMELEMAFEGSDLPYTVDIVDVYTVDSKFKQIIEEQRVSLLAKNGQVNVKKKWKLVTLGELVNVTRGRSYRSVQLQENVNTALVTLKSFKRGGGYRHDGLKPYTGPFNIDQIIGPGEMVIAQTDITQNGDVIGRPAIVPRQHKFSNLIASLDAAIVRVDDTDQLDLKFLYYRLLVHDYIHHVRSQATGTTVLHLPRDTLQSFQFLLPPLVEQQSIVYKLKMLDDKIELNKRMNLTLEKMARALFKSWFVDFDPVRAKLDGRWSSGESLPGLPAYLYDMFPAGLVDSELGAIPEGWEMKKLATIAQQRKSTVKPADIDSNTPYIALKHMPKRCIALSEWSLANGLASNKYGFKQGDILFGKLRPYFHKIGVAPLDGICSTDIVVVYPILKDWFGLVLCYMSSTKFVNYTNIRSTGTKMPRTNWSDMGSYSIVFPGLDLAKYFTDVIQLFVDKIISTIHNSRTLVAKRDALLPKLLSGDLRIPLSTRGEKI